MKTDRAESVPFKYDLEKFGYILRFETDNFGMVTRYYYDANRGRLHATVDTSTGLQQTVGSGTCYTYDDVDDLKTVMLAKYVSGTSYASVTTQNP